MQAVKLYIILPVIALLGIGFCPDLPAGGKTEKAAAKTKEPVEWFVAEVSDMFGGRVVTVASSNELTAINEEVTRNNRSMSLAYRNSADKWAAAEKERVEGQKNSRKKDKSEEPKPKQPFVLASPGLISVKVDGPYQDKTVAENIATEKDAVIVKEMEFAAKTETQRQAMMAEQALASYQARKDIEEQQRVIFMAELEALNGKSSMMGGREKVKLIGGRMKPLVSDMHRIRKPPPSSATATKVDKNAVENR